MKLRAQLMMRIEDCYRKSGVPQAAMAETLGLTPPRFNALLKGKVGLFSLDALVNRRCEEGRREEAARNATDDRKGIGGQDEEVTPHQACVPSNSAYNVSTSM